MSFKITNRLKVNNDNFKYNNDCKRYITIKKTQKKLLTFPNQIGI
jgi:hypothetical protein